jgi:ribokinase
VAPGAANTLTFSDIDSAREASGKSACILTQFELPLPQIEYGLRLARLLGVATILNPAPACECSDDLLQLCDYVTPNEPEACALTGMPVDTMAKIE